MEIVSGLNYIYKYVASLRHFRRAMLFHWRSSAGCLIGSCFGVPAQAYLGSQQLGSTLGFDQNLSVTMKVCCSSSFIFFFTSYLAIGCKSSASVCRKPYIITGSVFWGQKLIRRDEAFISDVSRRNCASFNAKRAVDGKATTMMEGNRMKQIAWESFVRLYLSFPKPVNFCTEARWYLFGIAWCWRCCQVWPDAPVGRRHAFFVVVVVVVVATWCGTNGIWNGVGWVCFMLCVFSGDLAWFGTSGAMGDFVMFCSCCCLRAVSNRSCSSARYAGSDANNCQGVAWKHGCRLLNSACSPHCVPHMAVVMMWDQYLCGPLRPTLLQCRNNAVRENSWRFPDSFHAVPHIWSHQPQGSCESSLNHIRKRWEGWEEKLGWRVP